MKTVLNVYPEFKFSKSRPEVRDQFFETVCQFDFKVHALVINKSAIYSTHLRNNHKNFYNYFVQMLMKYDQDVLNNASIKIDGSANKEFHRALITYLRQQVGQGKIKKFKFVDSRTDNLIQLADMAVGAIARSYNENRNEASHWLTMLKKGNKIENIWNFK